MKIKIPQHLIDEKYIKFQKHPTLDLYIYNYTHKTQFERYWNEWTLMCRGLILDGEGNVISRPFGKFFNESEPEFVAPENEAFEIFEKLDGSFGQAFYYANQWIVASRGSFTSEQAEEAYKIFQTYDYDKLDKSLTYIFEIIY